MIPDYALIIMIWYNTFTNEKSPWIFYFTKIYSEYVNAQNLNYRVTVIWQDKPALWYPFLQYPGRHQLHWSGEVAADVLLPAFGLRWEGAGLHPQGSSPGLPAADQTLFSQQGARTMRENPREIKLANLLMENATHFKHQKLLMHKE